MGVVEDELQKYKAENGIEDDAGTPIPEPEPAEVPKEKIRVSSLDDIILDDPSLPDSLRGQPASALWRDRTDAIHKLNEAGFTKNKAETERDMAFALLEKQLTQLKAREAAAPPPPPPSIAERMRERGIDGKSFFNDSDATLPRVVEAGADAAEDRIRPRFETVEQKIARLEQENANRAERERNQTIVGAYQAARPEKISPADWNEFAPIASTYAIHNNKPVDNAQTYRDAYEWHQKISGRFGSTAAPTPAGQAPAAPAPPVGGGKPSAPPASKPSAHLSNKEREAAAKIVGIYQKLGMKATADDILSDLRKDPKTRSMFP